MLTVLVLEFVGLEPYMQSPDQNKGKSDNDANRSTSTAETLSSKIVSKSNPDQQCLKVAKRKQFVLDENTVATLVSIETNISARPQRNVDWANSAEEQEKLITKVDNLILSKIDSNPNGSLNTEGVSGDGLEDKSTVEALISLAERSLLQKIIRRGVVENKNDIEVQRKDPSLPLFSVKSFEALILCPQLLKGVYAMGFNAPSKIQETALPTLLAAPHAKQHHG